MQAGRLRHRIQIKSPVEARNAYGEKIVTWSTLVTLWASVEPIFGREFFDAEQVQSEISHKVRMRYYPGITPQMRVVHDGRTLEIKTVINVRERDTEMDLMCREMPDA